MNLVVILFAALDIAKEPPDCVTQLSIFLILLYFISLRRLRREGRELRFKRTKMRVKRVNFNVNFR